MSRTYVRDGLNLYSRRIEPKAFGTPFPCLKCVQCVQITVFHVRGRSTECVQFVYSVQFFFWSVSCKSEGKGAWGRVNIIYIFIIYIII